MVGSGFGDCDFAASNFRALFLFAAPISFRLFRFELDDAGKLLAFVLSPFRFFVAGSGFWPSESESLAFLFPFRSYSKGIGEWLPVS